MLHGKGDCLQAAGSGVGYAHGDGSKRAIDRFLWERFARSANLTGGEDDVSASAVERSKMSTVTESEPCDHMIPTVCNDDLLLHLRFAETVTRHSVAAEITIALECEAAASNGSLNVMTLVYNSSFFHFIINDSLLNCRIAWFVSMFESDWGNI